MPLQNRVTPLGQLIADPARGLFMGNRGGRIHDPASRTLMRRRWASRRWICCVTSFKNRQREVMGPGYTELFFLDEVTALAAGHRPCFECRRRDAQAFANRWQQAFGLTNPPSADDMDLVLHRERPISGEPDPGTVDINSLPDGAMITVGEDIFTVRNQNLWLWSPHGYHLEVCEPKAAQGVLITPSAIIEILRAGYLPVWHSSVT